VLTGTFSLEFTHNITHHAPLRSRQSQIAPEELLSQANCSAAIVAVNFEYCFSSITTEVSIFYSV
jgi:hypothetical protein